MLAFSASQSSAVRPHTFKPLDPCILYSSSPSKIKQFQDRVWKTSRWRRGDPPAKTIKAWKLKQHCLSPGWQKKLKQRWRELQGAYFDRRRAELWRQRVTPFYGCTTFSCGWYAIPTVYVDCESGGRGGPYPNIYGIISPTWGNYGGYRYAGSAEEASFREQSLIAGAIWDDVGSAAWAPFEGGCS